MCSTNTFDLICWTGNPTASCCYLLLVNKSKILHISIMQNWPWCKCSKVLAWNAVKFLNLKLFWQQPTLILASLRLAVILSVWSEFRCIFSKMRSFKQLCSTGLGVFLLCNISSPHIRIFKLSLTLSWRCPVIMVRKHISTDSANCVQYPASWCCHADTATRCPPSLLAATLTFPTCLTPTPADTRSRRGAWSEQRVWTQTASQVDSPAL